MRDTNLFFGGKITGNAEKFASLELHRADAKNLCRIWKLKLRAPYMVRFRETRNPRLDPAIESEDWSDEGDQFFVAYSPPPEPEFGAEGLRGTRTPHRQIRK